MNQNKRQSLYVTLGVIIVIVVTLILSIQSAYNYGLTKDQMILEIEKSSMETILSLEKNIANLMSAYAVHEYGELVLNEMIHNTSFAIIVEDINMGKILGEPTYISGKIRNKDNKIIDFDPNNLIQKAQLEACYFSEQHDVTGPNGVLLGKIRVYITSDVMNRELNEIISSTLLNTATITLLLVLVLFATIRRFILKPISNIIFAINDRDSDGIPRDLVPHGGALEVFSLSNTINKMITSVRASRVELEGHMKHLVSKK